MSASSQIGGCTEAWTAKRTPEKPIWLQQHHIGLIASWSLLGFLSALLLQQDLVLNLLHTRQSGFMDIGQVAPPAQPLSFQIIIFWSFEHFWIFHGYFQLFHGFRSSSPPLEPFGFVWTEYFGLEWNLFNCQQFVSHYLVENGLQLPLWVGIWHQLTYSVCGTLCGT